MSTILLVDNGSTKASATLQLRELAATLSQQVNNTVYPVSFQHADKIDPKELHKQPADVFYNFMQVKLNAGERDFILLPLFFGRSRVLKSFVTEKIDLLKNEFGDFKFTIADVIYPLPTGEPLLADIIVEHIMNAIKPVANEKQNIVVVDHGSPISQVTEVRNKAVISAQEQIDLPFVIDQAVMERREGKQYDFNGQLLADWLINKANAGEKNICIILLFFLPGRHAGSGGDIEEICQTVKLSHPDLNITISPLISANKKLLTVLGKRLEAAIKTKRLPCRGCLKNCQYFYQCNGSPWRLNEH